MTFLKIVHRWVPSHPDIRYRSHVDRPIVLLQIDDKYVPIAESAVELFALAQASAVSIEDNPDNPLIGDSTKNEGIPELEWINLRRLRNRQVFGSLWSRYCSTTKGYIILASLLNSFEVCFVDIGIQNLFLFAYRACRLLCK